MASGAKEAREQLICILAETLIVDEQELTPLASLSNDLNADSLDRVEIALRIEEEILGDNIEIPDEEASDWKTVADIKASMMKALKSKAA